MEYSAELARLEEFVDKLLAKYNMLKSECHALQETLRQRDDECKELKHRVSELSAERTDVGTKVSNLLDRIELWENEEQNAIPPGNGEQPDSQAPFFHDDPQIKTY